MVEKVRMRVSLSNQGPFLMPFIAVFIFLTSVVVLGRKFLNAQLKIMGANIKFMILLITDRFLCCHVRFYLIFAFLWPNLHVLVALVGNGLILLFH